VKRIVKVLSATALMVVLMAGTMVVDALAAPPEADEERLSKGKPSDPSCWGGSTAKFTAAEDEQPGIGEHASDPPAPGEEDESEDERGRGAHDTPRLGVGNVARNDQTEGTRPSDHAVAVGGQCGEGPDAG
jgi:hypothetical protein